MTPLKIISHNSKLAVAQVEEVMSFLPQVPYTIQSIAFNQTDHRDETITDSLGLNQPGTDFDEALLLSEADIAICPEEDLPYPLHYGLDVLAILPSKDNSGSFIAVNSVKSAKLKKSAIKGSLVVIAKRDRLDLRALFFPFDRRNFYGKVYLVGAGPGNPDLLTLRAHNILKKADIIYYDDLLDAKQLNDYPGEKHYVGKRKSNHSYHQDDICDMLYRSAMEGKMVVRLKGGDPSIYGRSGEEVQYLHKRHVVAEIIPGITSAIAASASSLIPLTQRELSSSVQFLTSHGGLPYLDGKDNSTLVYYMSASKLKELSDDLLNAGFDPSTKVALVYNISNTSEKVEYHNLLSMAHSQLGSPLIIIIGKVVNEHIRYHRLLYTGLNPHSLHFFGKVQHYPLIKLISHVPKEPIDLLAYDAIVFTSAFGVNAFFQKYYITTQKIYAIGRTTKNAIETYGCKDIITPEQENVDALYDLIKRHSPQKCLYPCSDLSNNRLHDLTSIQPMIFYRTEFSKGEILDLSTYTAIYFSSPSTVTAFYKLYNSFPSHLLYLTKGPVTYRYLLSLNVAKDYIINYQDVTNRDFKQG